MMTALTAPVPRRWTAGRQGGSSQDQGCPSTADSGSPLFGVDLLHIESWLDDHPMFRDEVATLVRLATPAEEPEDQGTESHFACTVLVNVVVVLQNVDDLRERVVNGTANALSNAAMVMVRARLGSDSAARLEPLVVAVLAYVVDAALPGFSLVDPEVLMSLRLAAVLACPDPDDHADVFNHCLHPLVTTVIESSGLA